MKWWKIVLAVLGGILLALTGVAFFLDTRREVAFEKYRRRKRELERERARLEEADQADRARIEELERQVTELQRDFLLRSAATREEIERIREMTPEEVADETSRLEKLLRDRLGLAGGAD